MGRIEREWTITWQSKSKWLPWEQSSVDWTTYWWVSLQFAAWVQRYLRFHTLHTVLVFLYISTKLRVSIGREHTVKNDAPVGRYDIQASLGQALWALCPRLIYMPHMLCMAWGGIGTWTWPKVWGVNPTRTQLGAPRFWTYKSKPSLYFKWYKYKAFHPILLEKLLTITISNVWYNWWTNDQFKNYLLMIIWLHGIW